ncbi:MAG: hypothetical protein HN778_04740 [Prolixibacteraceae bacterium]|jgi:hypothetical protein|nr:hypothetical protein [Prolixibacteraceae bacterium]MBT6767112.1 hypothetical protein [Prolixibacteraceae bacterium]MBT7000915.1 hypothetical protein [Prolixibacteraceae bacterium]MBT7394123.1 hypothetical protein [Prolixibacteraceae bacterium]
MKKNKLIRFFKKLHKWPSIIIAFFAILFATSGIVMNHRQTFSPIDVSRKLLPSNYKYNNWNLAAVRGSVEIDSVSHLMYGNIGIWKTNDDFKNFEDFNQGFPKGIDNRKIYSVVRFKNEIFAGTQLGLYKRNVNGQDWQKLTLPVKKDRIADIALKNDTLLILTRHYLLTSTNGNDFHKIQLPEPVGYKKETGLFNTFWELHSGELFGLPGQLAVDLFGLVTIFLAITGLLHFFFPKIIRRRKKKEKKVSNLVGTKKVNLRWHNVVGYIFVLFLIINTFSGMHLRPPLLIPIANKKVGIIPNTHMDSPNPWFDKLRRVHFDDKNKQYIFSTSEGFYFADENFTGQLQPAFSQPPVSIMGCNVFKSLDEQNYLVGSFSGMFLWNTKTGAVHDFFTRQPYSAPERMASPIAANTVTGLVEGKENVFWFDFNNGVQGIVSMGVTPSFPEMSGEIRINSPMSLWNAALEIHTGRIFEHLVGPLYILYVPFAGICILLVLISGFFIWWMVYRKKG